MTPAQVDAEKPSRLGAPALLSVLAGTMKEAAALGGLHGWVVIDQYGGVVTTTPQPTAQVEPNGQGPA